MYIFFPSLVDATVETIVNTTANGENANVHTSITTEVNGHSETIVSDKQGTIIVTNDSQNGNTYTYSETPNPTPQPHVEVVSSDEKEMISIEEKHTSTWETIINTIQKLFSRFINIFHSAP